MKFNAVELALISVMRRQPRKWYTTNELADKIQVAWETADKHLQSLYHRGYLVKGRKLLKDKKTERTLWRLY